MKGPFVRAAALVAVLWVVVSCLDISSPLDGIASVSTVIPPSPSVIVGDVSRDSLGQPAPLRVYAFNTNGDTVRDAQVSFFVLDTLNGLSIDPTTGIAHGDTLSPSARVVARVMPAGATSGGLQTSVLPLPVTIAPDTVFLTSTDTLFINLFSPTDSLAFSKGVSVRVLGADRTAPVNAYLVRYMIDYAPAAKSGATTAFFVDESNKPATNDTTSSAGDASRRVALRRAALSDEADVWSTIKPESVVVRALVQYKGQDIPDSPIKVVIPIKSKLNP
jgi:hypothetical protein